MTAATRQRLGAEFLGTFVLVFAGCGTAVLDAGNEGVDLLGVAVAFGVAVLVMAYAVGAVSGGHFNPAVTIGLAVARRFPWSDVLAYVITQAVAAIVAASVLFGVASGRTASPRTSPDSPRTATAPTRRPATTSAPDCSSRSCSRPSSCT